MKKRLTLLSLLLLFTMTAMAQTLVDGIYYNLYESDNTAEVTSGTNYSGDIVIPASISVDGVDYSVTSIGNGAFRDCFSLTSIEIPNSVTYIEDHAFSDCSGLTSIVVEEGNSYYDSRENCNAIIETASNKLIAGCQNTVIPNSVTEIGSRAFQDCSSLWSIEIPNSVTEIGDYAFSGCSSLWSIEIPNSVTSIGDDAFAYCSGLMSIEIPNSVTSIGFSAFQECSSLTSIEIPNSVTEIGSYAFCYCSDLTSIVVEEGNYKYDSRGNCNAIIETASNKLIAGCQNTVIPNSVTAIGDHAFSGCSSLTSIEIPNSVTEIGDFAFCDCSGLTSIEIPNSVTEIGRFTFYGCSSLTSIEIPTSVTKIGSSAFAYCSGLTSIVVEEGNSYYDSRENCNAIIETASNKLIVGCQNTVIPNSVTSIGESAFYGCSSLTSIEIPNSVTAIGGSAFAFCSGLTSITMQRATPPTVGNYLFDRCSKLETIYVPAGAAEAYNVAPWNAYYIVEKEIEIINPMLVDGLYYNVDVENKTAEVVAAPNDTKYSGDIVIPASISINGIEFAVTSIGESAFYGCRDLMSIEIPNSVTSIADHAFNDCSGLTSIKIPNSVTSIGNYAFYECLGLTSIEIPNSVTSIGSGAFSHCSSLTSIEIPNSVTSIGSGVFEYCPTLTSIVVEEGNSYYDSRENCNALIETSSNTLLAGCMNSIIPNSVTSIGSGAFEFCFYLTSIEIPNSVTSIGDYAFRACLGLTSIEIPNSVTSIGYCAFSDCFSLTSIEIPNSVTSIGELAFSGCSDLTSITMQRATPPAVGDDLFYSCNKLETIYVPVGASEAYNEAPWNRYNILEREVTGIEGVTLEEWPADVYDLNGRMVKAQAENLDELPKGVYIVNGKKFVK